MPHMRLDKFLGMMGCCSRTEAKKLIRSGAVTVNGRTAPSADEKIDTERDTVIFCGSPVVYRPYTYIILNKPEGVVSATEDGRDRTVLDLVPEHMRRAGLFPCGRLDKNTVGLVLLTDNGVLAHRLLAPKSHVTKEYYFRSKFPLTPADVSLFEQGVLLEDGYETKPAKLFLEPSGDAGRIILIEGKYHQIKRMLEALHNKIIFLERIRFGPLTLEGIPNRGDIRYLTDEEIAALESHGTNETE